MDKLKIVTVVGTRPEIIRLAEIIKLLDVYTKHILVHTGQNFDYQLNDVFFKDLNLRKPNYNLGIKEKNVNNQIGSIISKVGNLLIKEKPDGFLVLGDTNSCLSVIAAKKLKIPIFHIEAGDRSFDINVPEETNRKIVDHVSDINIPYTEHSRRNLLSEGIPPDNIYVVGSPVNEVYKKLKNKITKSKILNKLKLKKKMYFAASIHREENVDISKNFLSLIDCFNLITEKFKLPIIVSTHPRTKNKLLEKNLLKKNKLINWSNPFGLIDYLKLQINSKCVISDSGTIHEDSSILNFQAIAIRNSTEKIESLEKGHTIIAGLDPASVYNSVNYSIRNKIKDKMPEAYLESNVSNKVVKLIIGMTKMLKSKIWKIK
jgi:UDP-N-acetylglucosamine 2-epimerase (non-hydrolysing)|tara:strand:+ start:3184 stop:4305 length:1122 start_codon:yes stop_codon:yes gene_type:complete